MVKPGDNVPVAGPMFHSRGGGCNARKAAKRAIYPWINSQIVAVAESGNFAQLVATIQIHAPQMNLVNLATALHRLARLAQCDVGAQLLLQEGAVLANLANYVHGALRRAASSAGPPQCQALANITWSHATMGFVDLSLLQLIADIALRSMAGFKPFELSTILWAFAKLGTYDPAAWDVGSELFELGACRVASSPEDFHFRCLVMTAWAFATAGHHDPDLFQGIAPRMTSLAHGGSSRELTTALWAFTAANVRDERLFLEITRRVRLEDLTQEEFKSMLRSLASVGFAPKAFMEHVVKVSECMDVEVQRVARALLVLAVPMGEAAEQHERKGRSHAGSICSSGGSTRAAPSHAGSGSSLGSASEMSADTEEQSGTSRRRQRRRGRAPLAAKQANEQPQAAREGPECNAADAIEEFPSAAWRVSEPVPETESIDEGEEGKPGTGRKASAACWDSPRWGHLITVKNTFLHVDEEDEGDAIAYDSLARPLPPSLDIIPKDVPQERLAAYRTEYQRFRAGGAAGARGELSASVA